ncbi:zinc-dependent alcohol dehydrogenase [Tengunoibacter tsumagoiensis]|nr:zinc-dependent alcohol dehydrogenase [Tengunoibacter tsumagoiensis]
MKAVVYHGLGDIRLDTVREPRIKEPTDAIIRLTASAICGTDLHMVRGTFPGMRPGTILGHEGVGIVEEVGKDVRNFKPGDRVVIPSTIGCGNCAYCRQGYYAQCDIANPKGKNAGTAFFGGPELSGPFDGLQAEYARVPFANVNLVRLPDAIPDDEAIMLSDIIPTAYFGALLAEVGPGDTVAVFGCGPVGQFVIACSKILGAERVIAIDTIPTRLEMARKQGAETIDFNSADPIEVIHSLTHGLGAYHVIDAVGVDANQPHSGPAIPTPEQKKQFAHEQKQVAPVKKEKGGNWHPGDAPSQVAQWAVGSIAKGGTLGIVGVYPQTATSFPIGAAMEKQLKINMGNCNHRKYLPELVRFVEAGLLAPSRVLTQHQQLLSAIDAYRAFDERQPGWIKVELVPAKSPVIV